MDSTIKALTSLLRLLESWKEDSLKVLKDESGPSSYILQEYNIIKSRIALEINNRRLIFLRAQSLKLKSDGLSSGLGTINQKEQPALSVAEAIDGIISIMRRLEDQDISKRPTDQNRDEMLRKSSILGSDPIN